MSPKFLRLVWRQMNVQIRIRTLSWYTLLLFILQPAMFSGVGMLLSRAAGNPVPDLVYTVIGGGIMGMWSGLVFTSTFDITRDRRDGALELIVGSPTSLGVVEAIRTFTNVVAGLVSLGAAFLFAMLVFRYSLAGVNILGALVSLLLILFAMWCLGVFLANFIAWSRLTGAIADLLEIRWLFYVGLCIRSACCPASCRQFRLPSPFVGLWKPLTPPCSAAMIFTS